MATIGKNEGIRVLEEFVCEAIPASNDAAAPKKGAEKEPLKRKPDPFKPAPETPDTAAGHGR
jgi:hypothetical protein